MKFIFIRVCRINIYSICVRCACVCTLTTGFSFVLKYCLVSHSPRCQLFVWFLFQENFSISLLRFIRLLLAIQMYTLINGSFLFVYLFFISVVVVVFFHSFYLIVTSNKCHIWMYECWFSFCLTSPLIFDLRLSMCGHFKYYFDFKFVTHKISVEWFAWIKTTESPSTALIKKLLQWKQTITHIQNIYYFRFKILFQKS